MCVCVDSVRRCDGVCMCERVRRCDGVCIGLIVCL